MIRSVSLWHVTPADLGVEFFDPTETVLSTDEKLYRLVNDPGVAIDKHVYSKKDYQSLLYMRKFLHNVRAALKPPAAFCEEYPGIEGCIAKYMVHENLFCYIMVSGIAVFYERGNPIPFEDENYFSLPVFYERQICEDDYCTNPECTPRKKPLYDFLHLLWRCVDKKKYIYSATPNFGNNGIEYTLCITMVDVPDLISNNVDLQLKKNIRALLDTSAFNNILQEDHWELIKKRIDDDDISDLQLQELSDNLIFADNWSGVLLAGDLTNNEMCLRWFMEFELFLQANWLLFDAYCENVARINMSPIELQEILNRVEFVKVKLDNDISSNMEQCRHIMRNSLIESSDINTIYHRMYGMVSNKLKLKLMNEDKEKSRFALFSDISLLVIAILQIYSVIEGFLGKDTFGQKDLLSLGITLLICVVCIWVMIKGKR